MAERERERRNSKSNAKTIWTIIIILIIGIAVAIILKQTVLQESPQFSPTPTSTKSASPSPTTSPQLRLQTITISNSDPIESRRSEVVVRKTVLNRYNVKIYFPDQSTYNRLMSNGRDQIRIPLSSLSNFLIMGENGLPTVVSGNLEELITNARRTICSLEVVRSIYQIGQDKIGLGFTFSLEGSTVTQGQLILRYDIYNDLYWDCDFFWGLDESCGSTCTNAVNDNGGFYKSSGDCNRALDQGGPSFGDICWCDSSGRPWIRDDPPPQLIW